MDAIFARLCKNSCRGFSGYRKLGFTNKVLRCYRYIRRFSINICFHMTFYEDQTKILGVSLYELFTKTIRYRYGFESERKLFVKMNPVLDSEPNRRTFSGPG
jgi:hypothetical protein